MQYQQNPSQNPMLSANVDQRQRYPQKASFESTSTHDLDRYAQGQEPASKAEADKVQSPEVVKFGGSSNDLKRASECQKDQHDFSVVKQLLKKMKKGQPGSAISAQSSESDVHAPHGAQKPSAPGLLNHFLGSLSKYKSGPFTNDGHSIKPDQLGNLHPSSNQKPTFEGNCKKHSQSPIPRSVLGMARQASTEEVTREPKTSSQMLSFLQQLHLAQAADKLGAA